jgi:hypothetical protein
MNQDELNDALRRLHAHACAGLGATQKGSSDRDWPRWQRLLETFAEGPELLALGMAEGALNLRFGKARDTGMPVVTLAVHKAWFEAGSPTEFSRLLGAAELDFMNVADWRQFAVVPEQTWRCTAAEFGAAWEELDKQGLKKSHEAKGHHSGFYL